MNSPKSNPPRLAQRLLRRFLRDELSEEVLGDLDQQFEKRLKTGSVTRAKLSYWYETFNYLRPFAMVRTKSHPLNNRDMLANYFKIGWRNLTKQKMYSSIKIGGFAIGIAACLLITLYIRNEISYDKYPDKDRIYRIVKVFNNNGEIEKDVWLQAPFASALKEDYPEIENVGRYLSSELFGAGPKEVRVGDKIESNYDEGFVYFDQELLDILKIPFVYGNPSHALDQPNTVVITKRKADKYFPNEDPVGKVLILNNDETRPRKIGGVIEDIPTTSHLNEFDFLMTLKGANFYPGEETNWGATNYPTYILLKPGADAAALEKKMISVLEKYLLPLWLKEGQVNAKDILTKASFQLQPIEDIHLKSVDIHAPERQGDIRFVWLFGGIALFILLLAIINFVNLSTAKSANRAKEVGLRKTVGSFRSNIVNQFLTESLLFSFLSFAIGVIVAWLLLPYFNELAAKSIEFPWKEWPLFPIVFLAATATGILAGLYPALYLSSFKPINVLKGHLSQGSKSSTMRSSLVIFQFATSIVLIIATLIIYQQVKYILNKDLGFNKDQVLLIQGTNTLGDQTKSFKDEILGLSQVKSASVSDYLPVRGTKRNGNPFWNEGKKTTEKSIGGQFWRVDYDYVKTLGIKLVDGRDFSVEMPSDSDAIIINQSMVRELGLKDPVGKRIENHRRIWNIIGVVEDFHFETLRDKIYPLSMVLGYNSNIVSIKVNSADMSAVIPAVESIWKRFAPHQPIRYTFLDESFARMHDDVQRMGRIFTTFAVLAILVACLGLFALSSFMVEQRSKEISIRLVLGASMTSIFSLLTRNFLALVLIAFVLAVPIAWYMMTRWLQDFNYRIDIEWEVFALSGIMAVFIALFTISYQSIRAGLLKPAATLKAD